jgi:hypothetical protein
MSLNATGMKGKGGSVVCVRGRRGVREGSEEWRGAGGVPTYKIGLGRGKGGRVEVHG